MEKREVEGGEGGGGIGDRMKGLGLLCLKKLIVNVSCEKRGEWRRER